jgi:hypothetical protein
MPTFQEETYYFLLSATRRALLGKIPPFLRAVAIEWHATTAHLYFYINGEITTQLHDDCTSIGAEVIASFSRAKICEHVISLYYPNSLPNHTHWAFRRFEDLYVQPIDSHDYEGISHSAQYSMIGKITTNIRGVAIEKHDRSASLFFYIDGPIKKDLLVVCKEIATLMQLLNPDIKIILNTKRIDHPDSLPKHDLDWIYLRQEY